MNSLKARMRILWEENPGDGTITAKNGELESLKAFGCDGAASSDGKFTAGKKWGGGGLELGLAMPSANFGPNPTIVSVGTKKNPFTFLPRDVLKTTAPVIVPEYGVAVTKDDNIKSYAEARKAVEALRAFSSVQRFETEPEESLEAARARNRRQYCPTWLGVARDMRIFRVSHELKFGFWGNVQPCFHTYRRNAPEGGEPLEIKFVIGRGSTCSADIKRRLEEGCLPILRSTQKEDDMTYHLTAFATLETSPLSDTNVRGTHHEACYAHSGGNGVTKEQREQMKDFLNSETYGREEELVCVMRFEAVNTGKTPCYGWFKAPWAHGKIKNQFDANRGFSMVDGGMVCAVALVDGRPAPCEDLPVLVQPGEAVIYDILIPHGPVSEKRADKIMDMDIKAHLDAARKFWKGRLEKSAKASIPEKTIDEMFRAGLLHLDIASIGLEPEEPVAATVGWYSPIGSESAPIIQFFDSMGLHKLAERCLEFFIRRQKENGHIQNFHNYQIETGPFLWTAGEHYRVTRDLAWLKRVGKNIRKACDFLVEWRNRNKTEENKAKGCHGLIDGKVADPEDYFHSFMFNAATCQGLQRAAEMLMDIDKKYAGRLEKEVAEFKEDIAEAFRTAMAKAPLAPVGDGSWSPWVGPWTESVGAQAMGIDGTPYYSHGSFLSRDMLGISYLASGEILDAKDPALRLAMKTNQSPMTNENAAVSQPYYSRHDIFHLKAGDTKPFLKMYYNQMTGLADLETYTFWEHFYEVSQHKTHEEAWFLMQTRWMLWLEEDDSLRLLGMIPRKWMESGKSVTVENAASHFGRLSFSATSNLEAAGEIRATIQCHEKNRLPRTVLVRLPHPEGRRAASCEGGVYDRASETVRIDDFTGSAEVSVRF